MDRLTKHHIRPRSRGGGRRKNLVVLPQEFHRALHTVFQDLDPSEYALFLETVLQPGTRWTAKDLHNLRKRIKDFNG